MNFGDIFFIINFLYKYYLEFFLNRYFIILMIQFQQQTLVTLFTMTHLFNS